MAEKLYGVGGRNLGYKLYTLFICIQWHDQISSAMMKFILCENPIYFYIALFNVHKHIFKSSSDDSTPTVYF